MRWADNLYVSDSTYKRKEKIIRKANRNIGLIQVCFITLASNPENLLDIFEAKYLKQPSFYNQDLDVVGIASDKSEATELVRKIVDDVYRETGDVNVRTYFSFPKEDSRNRKRIRRRLWGM